jgi:flagellar hook-associated protein 3 FlgL
MRITQSIISRMGLVQLDFARNRLARTQEQAATGLRINRPSDDPVDYRTARSLRDAMSQTERFQRSIDLARTRLRTTENALTDSLDVLAEAKVAALAARNGTTGDTDRPARRQQVEALFEALVDHANSVAPGGGYVFAGTASDRPPFVQTGAFTPGGPAPVVAFQGQGSNLEVEIDEGLFIEVTLDGQRVFQGGVDVFATLGELWTAIDQDDDAGIDVALGDLDRAMQQLRVEQARIGNEERKADVREPRLALQIEELTAQLSFVEDADAFEVYSDLAAQEAALQASLQVTSRLLGPTLLEFL